MVFVDSVSIDTSQSRKFTMIARAPGDFLPYVERVMGIEPTLRAWEAPVLPLNYTRLRVRRSKEYPTSVNLSRFGASSC